ncbi:MAG: UDP-galactopyranose mutase, partial [Bdellovibrionota bacterium]
YGPHYFRTNSKSLLDYLSKFTNWIPGNYVVKSALKDGLVPFPINLSTLEQFFGRDFNPKTAEEFIRRKRERFETPRNSEEFVLSRVGRELFEALYADYTSKQWGQHPRDLPASICGRIPIRFNRDERYVDHLFQVMPDQGYTRMFGAMLKNPKIEVRLGVDFRELRRKVKPKVATVFCGPIDEYFDNRLGKLPWRSLKFEFQEYSQELRQPCVQINYPQPDTEYTRSVEFKHVTAQKHPHTVVAYERPAALGEPFYPMPNEAGVTLYKKYEELLGRENLSGRPAVYFSGRLATYRYLNMDEAIEGALETFQQIKNDQPGLRLAAHQPPRDHFRDR